MYTTAKNLSAFCIILAVVNIIATVLFFLYFANSNLGFSMNFTCIMYLVSAALISLLMAIGMRSLCQDINLETEFKATQVRELTKRVAELENKVNY